MIPQVNLFLFIFWRKLKTPKSHCEIKWPLEGPYIVYTSKVQAHNWYLHNWNWQRFQNSRKDFKAGKGRKRKWKERFQSLPKLQIHETVLKMTHLHNSSSFLTTMCLLVASKHYSRLIDLYKVDGNLLTLGPQRWKINIKAQ